MTIVQWALRCGLMEGCVVQYKNMGKWQKEFHICKQAEFCEISKDKFSRVRSDYALAASSASQYKESILRTVVKAPIFMFLLGGKSNKTLLYIHIMYKSSLGKTTHFLASIIL